MINILKFIKYIYTYYNRKYVYNSLELNKLKRKNKTLIIIGNAYNFENEKFLNCDILLLNNGPFQHKIEPDFHIFELPKKNEDKKKFIDNNSRYNKNSIIIFRPNSQNEKALIKKLKNVIMPNELRIAFPCNKLFLKFQFKIASTLKSIPYYRSSISFAISFGNLLCYEEIKLVGFDPYRKSNPHATSKKVNGTNVYEYLNYCNKNNLINFIKSDKCYF